MHKYKQCGISMEAANVTNTNTVYAKVCACLYYTTVFDTHGMACQLTQSTLIPYCGGNTNSLHAMRISTQDIKFTNSYSFIAK